jgi:uncharacterized protein (UPF0332 family)
MTLTAEEKATLSNVRMEKAREFLDDARANLKEKRYRTAVNRSYYAVLNAVRSLLILQGANPETHEGVITILSLKFIKTGALPVKIIKGLKMLLTRRTDVDYGDFDTIDSKEADDSIKIAEEIIDTIDKKRKSMINK